MTDHNRVYSDTTRPVLAQGLASGESADTEDNYWIGTGAVTVGVTGLRLGRGSVVGANSVVISDVPAYSVVAGNPVRWSRNTIPRPRPGR